LCEQQQNEIIVRQNRAADTVWKAFILVKKDEFPRGQFDDLINWVANEWVACRTKEAEVPPFPSEFLPRIIWVGKVKIDGWDGIGEDAGTMETTFDGMATGGDGIASALEM
jgi:hypothetical protein